MLADMSAKATAWLGGVVVLVAAAGMGVYLGVAGLSKASELAGVISGFVGLAGLAVAAYGVIQAHRDAVTPTLQGPPASQSVTSTGARAVTQVKDATGSVRIGPSSHAVPPASLLPAPPKTQMPPEPSPGPPADATSGAQAVTNSDVSGAVTQVEGVGGDVEIDQ